MADDPKRTKTLDKFEEVNALLDEEEKKKIKKEPKVKDLGDEDTEICEGTLCLLSSEYNILIIHEGKVEKVNDLSPEEIVEKIEEYTDED